MRNLKDQKWNRLSWKSQGGKEYGEKSVGSGLKKWKWRESLCPYSNTCHTSGSGWSGRFSTESSCEDCLSEQAWTLWDQLFVVYSQRPWKQPLPALCSCKALGPGPGPDKMHSQAHLPFLLYLRYYFCKETLVLWKGWGTSLSWRERLFFTSSVLPSCFQRAPASLGP